MKRIVKYLDNIIYWSIVFIPFSIAVAPALTYCGMGFLFFAFLVKKLIKKEKLFSFTSVGLPYLCLIAVSIASFLNSIDMRSSFQGIAKLLQNALLFLICAEEIKDKRHISRIFCSLILGTGLASIDALWQVGFGRDFIRGRGPILNLGLKRATAAFPNANVLGVYLSAAAPLVIGMGLYYFKKVKKIIIILSGFLVSVGILLTFSRGTALALYISILFLGIARKDKLIAAFLIIILLIFPFIAPSSVKDWAKEVNYNPAVFMLNADRISIYRNTLNMIKHHPLIGVGINTFSTNYLKYKLPEPDNARTADHMYAHNNFLQMAGETGLLGLAAFLWLLFRIFKKSASIYKGLTDEYLKVVSLSLIACFIAFLVNGLTETSLYYSRVAMIFWYLVGLSLALGKFINADNTAKG